MSIFIISLLTGVTAYFLISATFSIVEQRNIDKRLKGALGMIHPQDNKSVVYLLKGWAMEIGKLITRLETPFIKIQLNKIQEMLDKSGTKNIKVNSFVGIQVLSGAGLVFLSLFVFGVSSLVLLFIIFLIGGFIPISLLREKINRRQKMIFKGLPDVLDILSLLADAGVDFGKSLNIMVENEKGILVDEFYLAQQEINLGKNRIAAMNDMARRVDNMHLTNVVGSIVRSIQSGVPVGQTLKTLAENFRQERAIMAEKLGAQAPVKIMIPLILLIFPTIFIIIFAPIVLSFISGGFW